MKGRSRLSVAASIVVGFALIPGPSSADWDVGDPSKWIQLPDETPMGMDVKFFNPAAPPSLWLADDFLCTTTGPIVGVHIWCSFLQDIMPVGGDVSFQISFWTDVPAIPGGPFSRPESMLWSTNVTADEYIARHWTNVVPGEAWYDPSTQTYLPFADTNIWECNFRFDPETAFIQQGSAEQPIVYWLVIRAQFSGQQVEPVALGWKTSMTHWNDDAVWAVEPPLWNELRYPVGHPLEGQSIDLSFVIVTTNPPPVATLDFGDASDNPYPTLLANNGARHVIVPGVMLGQAIDAEPDGQPDGTATGDDKAGAVDDEDGVTFSPYLVRGQSADAYVVASTAGYLNAWIDFTADGDWADPGEQVFVDALLLPGTNTLSFMVPPYVVSSSPQARFRFTTNKVAASTTGLLDNGEVEDYEVTLDEWDLGDAPDVYGTTVAANGARHIRRGARLGPFVDTELDGQPSVLADLDDLMPGPDDEDGVLISGLLNRGSNTTITVTSSGAGYLNAWLDMNRDGDWADASEHFLVDVAVVVGPNALSVSVPKDAVVGETYARFRLSSLPGLLSTGVAPDGEVEDVYAVILQDPPATGLVITNISWQAGGCRVMWAADTSTLYRAEATTNLLVAPQSWTTMGGLVRWPTNWVDDTLPTQALRGYRIVAPFVR